ncbi:hypothetical protein H6P81_012321 [Aristolochia fimbriata]|uniref:Cation/H+ exchanger domain-containing protein n=1 Tax=Aristolochia fimbriata TaxID=158543 RepID=A0AAV7EG40_ARIFI|nr:hypothetical protein H6P81_012321 [Aristolochia fimbriata]
MTSNVDEKLDRLDMCVPGLRAPPLDMAAYLLWKAENVSIWGNPSVYNSVLAGVIIGPTLLGSYEGFDNLLFPVPGQVLSSTLRSLAMIYYLFVEGLKQDTHVVTHAGKKELIIALNGILCSFLLCACFVFATKGGFLQESIQAKGFIVYLPLTLCFSVSPAVQPILEELGLLNSDLGRFSMSLSMLNTAVGTVVALTCRSVGVGLINGRQFMIYNFLIICCLHVFPIAVAQPVILWIVRRVPEGGKVESGVVVSILLLTLVLAGVSDLIGSGTVHVPLVFATLIPAGPPLGSALVLKINTFLHFFLIPHFYLFNGRLFSLFDAQSRSSIFFALLAILASCLGKFVGTLFTAKYYRIPHRESITMGLILCFKGINELLIVNSWRHFNVIDGPTVASVEVAMMMVTAIATPLVRHLAKRSTMVVTTTCQGRSLEESKLSGDFRLMMCVHDEDPVPTLLKLLEASNGGTKTSPTNVCLLHLVELAGHSAPILAPYKTAAVDTPPMCHRREERTNRAFENQVDQMGARHVTLSSFISISPYKTMHLDIYTVAMDKKVCFLILPFHKQTKYAHERTGQLLVRNILREAPCSLGVLLDRSNLRKSSVLVPKRTDIHQIRRFSFKVGAVFLGGEDDQEALRYVSRMVENPDVSLHLLRCCLAPNYDHRHGADDRERERLLDDKFIEDFREKTMQRGNVVYREESVGNVGEMMNSFRSMGADFDLMIVGRRHPAHSFVMDVLSEWSESVELGVLGDFFSSSDFAIDGASVLSIQKYKRPSS